MYKSLRIILCFLALLQWVPAFSAEKLFPGEKMITAANFPTLVHFTKGDSQKPLVIFVPGDSHLARIAYGYPKGNPKDFLAYWLHEKGYSFLGVSYPSDNAVYSKNYPAFSIQDWGKQIAAAANIFIKNNNLSKHIIVVGWSMGGSAEESVSVWAKQNGLMLDAFIGLSAVPPLPQIMQSGAYSGNKMLPNKLADRSQIVKIFTQMQTIIPKEIYLQQFIGNTPVALIAEGYHYQNGKFIYDINKTLTDSGIFNFAETPWIALIRDNSPSTAKISLIDPTFWNYLRAEMINKKYLTKLSSKNWRELSKLIDDLPNNLTLTVPGNHFFFVGEKGAKETADKIAILDARIKKIKSQLESLALPQN